ncbi:MAG TPA: hypothetical protein VG733_11495 [Chthoniobacteraceae bacterium]|nr:hypothetical protein [Chthoniobacteraceae bacterium]
MDDRLASLLEKTKTLPGVNLMKNDKSRVIYIGKSTSLRDRVSSYFQKIGRVGIAHIQNSTGAAHPTEFSRGTATGRKTLLAGWELDMVKIGC